ncbi:F-box protein At1g49360-like [Lycium barbarum]|uniref:F-box protein At1g49360-like n=1 Tax=Lycium barbarum TaxID=112863 RepID=UPI00293EC08A|nr:F-box protein At1g49360-like [Lycium barbarum]
MSHDSRGMFFFNPISNDIIELPDLLEEHQNYLPFWTFSCPPDSLSSDCFVIGFEMSGSPPDVYIIKVGETRWTYHDFDGDNQRHFLLSGCNNSVFFRNNTVYVLGDEGDLGILSIKKNSAAETPVWKFYGKPFSRRKETAIRKIYTVEDVDNEGMLAVFLTQEEDNVEVWRYKINGRVLKREKITSLDNKTLFVSLGASYLKPCVAQGLENKIYFSMFHDNNKGVFYCLRNCKYYSFDYSVNKAYSSPNTFNLFQRRSCIWIEPEND